MIKEFQYTFEELLIVSEDLTELLGFEDGIVPEPFPEIIQQAIDDAPQFCEIKGGYKVFNSVKINLKEESIQIKDQTFFPTKIVTTQLKESTSAALFICTAGAEITNHANELIAQGDPMLGYIFDVIGSVTVEKAIGKIQKELELELLKLGMNISDRYSPGYCEWDVAEQQYLFPLMPKNFCGVSLSDSSLMNPIKSVSGIIGIGTNLQQKGYQCHWCTDKNCIYGRIKRKNRA
ncbi:MAG: hypothetical protein HQ522_22850 [Bacteroidetes bacterium]|nr:hypothetical protein [Bacteroidota bacterium]